MSSSLILNWWYPNHKFILEKIYSPCNWSNKLSIFGSGYLFLIITLLSCQQSMHNLSDPSFFFSNSSGVPHGETLGWKPLSNNFSNYYFNSLSSIDVIWYESIDIGLVFGTKSMQYLISYFWGRLSNSSKNTSGNSFILDTLSIFLTSTCVSLTVARYL